MHPQIPPDRHFGALFTGVFAVLAVVNYFRGGRAYLWLAALCVVFGIVTLARPKLLRPINILWMRFASLLHRIVSPVVLGVIFYVVITPVGLVQRLSGRDALRRRPNPRARSYWLPRAPPGPPPDSFKNQF